MSKFENYSFVIQARLGSTRLPGKILLSFQDSTIVGTLISNLISYGIERRKIIVVTTLNKLDDLTANYIHSLDVTVVRGDEANVLNRYQAAAAKLATPNIVRLTADNPIPDINLISQCIKRHETDKPDLTSTRFVEPDGKVKRYAPKGSSVDIMKKDSLLGINSEKCSEFEKEHVIPYFYRNLTVSVVKDYSSQRPDLSIDTIEDYVRTVEYTRHHGVGD